MTMLLPEGVMYLDNCGTKAALRLNSQMTGLLADLERRDDGSRWSILPEDGVSDCSP